MWTTTRAKDCGIGQGSESLWFRWLAPSAPLQGLKLQLNPKPRALPWAGLARPVGAEDNDAAHRWTLLNQLKSPLKTKPE